eukprot:12912273-Prorocentrum_lima.AAC.1
MPVFLLVVEILVQRLPDRVEGLRLFQVFQRYLLELVEEIAVEGRSEGQCAFYHCGDSPLFAHSPK